MTMAMLNEIVRSPRRLEGPKLFISPYIWVPPDLVCELWCSQDTSRMSEDDRGTMHWDIKVKLYSPSLSWKEIISFTHPHIGSLMPSDLDIPAQCLAERYAYESAVAFALFKSLQSFMIEQARDSSAIVYKLMFPTERHGLTAYGKWEDYIGKIMLKSKMSVYQMARD